MNQLYNGEITACYINISKNNKEYAVGYISLPDEAGTQNTYKFLVFKTSCVSELKEFGPEKLKGTTLGLVGVFAPNTYNGNTEFQLTVDSIVFPNTHEEIPSQPILNQPQTGIPEPINQMQIPTIPNN